MAPDTDFTGRQPFNPTLSTLCVLDTLSLEDAFNENPQNLPNRIQHRTQTGRQCHSEHGSGCRGEAANPNLSATVESLIEGFVARGRYARSNQRWLANLCADDWNSVLDEHGSFADSHATL